MPKSNISYTYFITRDHQPCPIFNIGLNGRAEVNMEGYLLVPLEKIVGMEGIKKEDYKYVWERLDALGPLVQVNVKGAQIFRSEEHTSELQSRPS